ncbi:MAG: class II aldolase/adducin family protein [Pseudomonadota bacterium]
MTVNLPSRPEDFDGLRQLSARFGADPMHVQGAGGNSSVKEGDAMWIKASGTLMGTALEQDIFVATDVRAMRAALERGDPVADQPKSFLLDPTGLMRPSIETSLHAVFDQRVVLHTHCVHTLAIAIRQDAEERLAERLARLNWSFVAYTKPGANLARSVRSALRADTNVVVLANHGLIVAGETVDAVAALQERVHGALAQPGLPEKPTDIPRLKQLLEGSEFCLPEDSSLHQLAIGADRIAQVATGSLYPDHVIFCGIAVPVVREGECLSDALNRIDETGAPHPPWLLVPGVGVVVRNDLTESARVMMRCLADVMARVPPDARLNYLTMDQTLELLNWDAEKYRQSLNVTLAG